MQLKHWYFKQNVSRTFLQSGWVCSVEIAVESKKGIKEKIKEDTRKIKQEKENLTEHLTVNIVLYELKYHEWNKIEQKLKKYLLEEREITRQ